MAGCADERFALPVLVEARCLADDHDVGRAGPHARDSLGARRVETALDARANLSVELIELG